MILKNGSVVLRAVEIEDAECLKNIINSPEIEHMVLGWSYPVSTKAQLDWISGLNNKDCVRYVVDVDGTAVGLAIISNIDFKNSTASVGIKLSENCPKQKGIGSTCVKLMTDFCFNELGLYCLTAYILSYNIASQKTYEKCGFVKDGVLRKRIFKGGKHHDLYAYSFLRDEFNAD